jgi:hypothetical protein
MLDDVFAGAGDVEDGADAEEVAADASLGGGPGAGAGRHLSEMKERRT